MKSESGHVKIGHTTIMDISKRMKSLQCGCPFRLSLIKMIDGGTLFEKRLHDYFEKFRCEGEWFLFTKEIEDYIEAPTKLLQSHIKKEANANPSFNPNRIRCLMEERGITMSELAYKMGKRQSLLYTILTGNTRVTHKTVMAFAAALGVPAKELLE